MNSEHSNENLSSSNEEKGIQFFSEMPVFPGGETAMLEFIHRNIRYPEYEIENNIHGKVKVEFTVEKDGKVTNVQAHSDIKQGQNLQREAERVVSLLPTFKPATQNGNPVRITMTIPINFYFVDWKIKLKRFFKSFIPK